MNPTNFSATPFFRLFFRPPKSFLPLLSLPLSLSFFLFSFPSLGFFFPISLLYYFLFRKYSDWPFYLVYFSCFLPVLTSPLSPPLMTSIPPQKQQALHPQGQSSSSTAPSSSAPVSNPPDLSLSSSAAASASYTHATGKSATDSTAAPVTVGGSSHHGQSTSAASSSVSGKPMQPNTVNPPSSSSSVSPSPGVTIVNGAPASQGHSGAGDHSRKPSVTITSAGTSGYIPNGGPASRPNSLQFGFANQQQQQSSSSPNMGNPAVLANQPQTGLGVSPSMNPRVTSPQTSPSPIPQPASSGGRPPPSSYQSQGGNVPNFGSFGDAGDANVCCFFFFFLFRVWASAKLVQGIKVAIRHQHQYTVVTGI